jgi:hypothetical protein
MHEEDAEIAVDEGKAQPIVLGGSGKGGESRFSQSVALSR